jgi:hypothetical protein
MVTCPLLVIEQVLEASTAENKQVLPGKTSVSRMAASSELKGIPISNDNRQGYGSRIHVRFAGWCREIGSPGGCGTVQLGVVARLLW